MLDGANRTWVAQNPHNQYQGIFKSHVNEGANDWGYNHNRLLNPGHSKIKVQYQIPVEIINMNSPDCTFILRTAYFAPWQMPPCTITVSINGQKVLKTAQVLSEDQGRTTHDSEMEEVTDEPGEIEVLFDGGQGVLFLWYFEILVKEA